MKLKNAYAMFMILLLPGILSTLQIGVVAPNPSVGDKLDISSVIEEGRNVYESPMFLVDADIYVPANYSTIQEAINAANPDDTIFVDAGVYNENVDVNKTLNIIGAGQGVAIVNASNPNDHAVHITANYVNISGFTMTGASGVGKAGIELDALSNINVSDNYVTNNSYGVFLDTSSNSSITGNTLIDNSYGFYLASSDGNFLYHNNIINNTQQAFDNGTNTWDDGYPSGGNYWSDWIEPDNYTGIYQNITGFDFLVDLLYNVSGGSNRDHYPFAILDCWKKPLFVPNVLLVKFNAGVSNETINQTIADFDTEIIEYFDLVDTYFLRITATNRSEWEILYLFQNDQNVEFALLDLYTYSESHLTHPNDPCYRQQWGLNNFGINPGVPKGVIDADIDAPQAWEHKTDCSDIVVAVIGTGVDLNHPDLVGNLWTNPRETAGNGRDDDGNGIIDDVHGAEFRYIPGPPSRVETDGSPDDEDGHETHVAGIIGAVGNNGIGVSGVNWRASIMVIKAELTVYWRTTPAGAILNERIPMDSFIAAMRYILRQRNAGVRVRVINYSWVFSTTRLTRTIVGLTRARANALLQTTRNAFSTWIGNADTAGILFVCAAGNEGVNIDVGDEIAYPAELPNQNIITVAASDNKDHLASFSNYGTTSVDLVAPGVDILSLAMHGQIIYRDNDNNRDVSTNDHRLTNVDTVFPPGSTVRAQDGDCLFAGRGFPLVPFAGNERHDEVVAANGNYDDGEHAYLDDGRQPNQVSAGDRRLSDVYINGALRYHHETVVALGDADVGRALVAFRVNERHRENEQQNGRYDAGEYIYLDADGDRWVSVGDRRLTSVESFYRACFPVVAGDNDDCYDLVAFGPNEKHDEVVAANGAYDVGEHVYLDADGNNRVSVGDRRLTTVPPYAAGTVVAAGDADVDRPARRNPLVPFQANERYALVTYMSGTSMATPFVSGAISHFWSQFPWLTHMEIKQYLEKWVDPRPGVAGSVLWGKGTQHDARLRMMMGDDFGDAPDQFTAPHRYPSKTRYIGASHEDMGEEWLGYCTGGDVSPEYDADVICNATNRYDADCRENIVPGRIPPTPEPPYRPPYTIPDRDFYDDGIRFLTPFIPCQNATLAYSIRTEHEDIVDAEGGRYLPGQPTTLAPNKRLYISIWIDWNQDGDWDDPGEYIFNRPHDPTLEWNRTHCSGWKYVAFHVPSNAKLGQTWLRARLDYGENVGKVNKYENHHPGPIPNLIDTYGLAQFGEVEDYPICVAPRTPIYLHADPPLLIDLGNPISTYWRELLPDYSELYHLTSWIDNCDGILSPCDYVDLTDENGTVTWYHVENVTKTMKVTKKPELLYSMYIEFEGSFDHYHWVDKHPVCTQWKEVYPYYCNSYHIEQWYDNGDGELSHSDQLVLRNKRTGEIAEYHVDEVATDIIITPRTPPSKPPIPKICTIGIPIVGRTISFDASFSYDPDGTIISYKWDFGDGTPIVVETDPVTTHIYTEAGTYTITLKVIDNHGLCSIQKETITVHVFPVGGYSLPINKHTTTTPLATYLTLIAIITTTFTLVRRRQKAEKKPKPH